MKLSKIIRKIVVLFVIGTFTGGVYLSSASPGLCIPEKQIKVMVDPRIELLTIVQYLVLGSWRMSDYDTAYAREVEETFEPFYRHPVLDQYYEMWYLYDFCNSIPHELMLRLSDPPELAIRKSIPKRVMDRTGGEKCLNDFLAYLRDFAKKTDFMYFFESHRDFYKEHVDIVTDEINKEDYVSMLEGYYGAGSSGYKLILSTLLYEGGYGVNVEGTMYAIIGPCGSVDDEPIFDEPSYLFNTTIHQFGYSFVGPLSSDIYKEIQKCSKLLYPIRYRMSRILYPVTPTWEMCMNEHLIRAITIRILEPKTGEEETKEKIFEEYCKGFAYIEYVLNKLTEYENNREIYPQFSDFYPRLQAMFMELCEYPTIPIFLGCIYASQNGVQLEWVDMSITELGFSVYRRESEDQDYVKISQVPKDQEYYRDNNIQTGINYQYIVAAIGEKGEIFTNHIDVFIEPTQPIAPKKLSVELNSDKSALIFSWDYSFSTEGFRLYEITEEREMVAEISMQELNYSLEVPKQGKHLYVITSWVYGKDETILESYDSNVVSIEIKKEEENSIGTIE